MATSNNEWISCSGKTSIGYLSKQIKGYGNAIILRIIQRIIHRWVRQYTRTRKQSSSHTTRSINQLHRWYIIRLVNATNSCNNLFRTN
jgi:hypothetical protein